MRIPLLIALVLLASCTTPRIDPQWYDLEKGVFVADWPVPSLGLYADAEERVVVVLPGGAADMAGIQAGDLLLELRPTEAAPVISTAPVPFSDDRAIWSLIREAMVVEKTGAWYSIRREYKPISGPFIVKIQRGKDILEIELLAEGQPPWTAGAPTPTPVPRALRYF
jgi:hypothetical protein